MYGDGFKRRFGLPTRFLFCIQVRGKKYEECAEHDGRDVKRRADVPAEFLRNILEDRKRGIARSYEKHIDGSAGDVTEDYVDAERYHAKRKKRKGCV